MEEKLKKSYGSSVLTDILMPDSIWNEPKDWMTSLLKKERLLSCVWNNDSGATLTDAIQSIHLIATASESDTGYISVEYALTSCAQSDAEINDLQDDVL